MTKFLVTLVIILGIILSLRLAGVLDVMPAPTPTPVLGPPPAPLFTPDPVITGVTVQSRTETSACITWTTDEPTVSGIAYGTTAQSEIASQFSDSGQVWSTSHQATLTVLEPETSYHYRIWATDEAENGTSVEDTLAPFSTTQTDSEVATTPEAPAAEAPPPPPSTEPVPMTTPEPIRPSPTASFACSLTSGNNPFTVQFASESTGNITNWSWDFGDGGTTNESNPSHTYTNAGTYSVSLTVAGPGGSSTETKRDYITVNETPIKTSPEVLLDQSNEPSWTGGWSNIAPYNCVGQSFVPKYPVLVAVEVGILAGNSGRGGDSITLTIIGTDGKTITTTSTYVSESFEGWLRFDISGGVNVAVGEETIIRLADTGKIVFGWKRAGDTYSSGSGSWGQDEDFFFRTYGMSQEP